MAEHRVDATHAGESSGPLLRLRNVQKTYGSKGGMTSALRGISFDVDSDEFVAVMGPSGSGKTTLLNCIATIDSPTQGDVVLAGQSLSRLRGGKLATFRRDKLGFVFQDSNLIETLTAAENISLALTLRRVSPREIEKRVADLSRRLGIADVLDKFPHEMSGGQRQRVAIARAVVGNPALVLADEPTGALDSRSSTAVLEMLSSLNRELSSTILMVTHDALAASYAHRVVFVRDGGVFTEIRCGDADRKNYYERILETVAFLGSGVSENAC